MSSCFLEELKQDPTPDALFSLTRVNPDGFREALADGGKDIIARIFNQNREVLRALFMMGMLKATEVEELGLVDPWCGITVHVDRF